MVGVARTAVSLCARSASGWGVAMVDYVCEEGADETG
jgi:hypothetical protein